MTIRAIVAMNKGRVIGHEGALPWQVPEDLRRFARLTKGGTVVMGRRTFDSLPEHARPLKGRHNIVVTKGTQEGYPPEVRVCSDLGVLIQEMKAHPAEAYWIIGGAALYRQTVGVWDEAHVTLIDGDQKGDTFMPPFEDGFRLEAVESGDGCQFLHYVREPIFHP
jgi:dihydrofolate reductase